MNKILNKINIGKIQDLYEIKDINSTGQLNLKDKRITMYKIDPANIVACDEDTKFRIYQAYLSCIRGLPKDFQIIVKKEKANFSKQIREYKERLPNIGNEGLKLALKKYIEYLEQIDGINKLYKTTHYLVVQNLDEKNKQDILNIFSNLNEFGIRITRISSQEEVLDILKSSMVKGECKWQ